MYNILFAYCGIVFAQIVHRGSDILPFISSIVPELSAVFLFILVNQKFLPFKKKSAELAVY
jgi:hypothetical protein